MSPTRRELPAWRQALEQHATWQHWTAALGVEWQSDGVRLRDVPPRWGADIRAAEPRHEGAQAIAPRMRLWNLVRLILRRSHRVVLVPTRDKSTVHMRVQEK